MHYKDIETRYIPSAGDVSLRASDSADAAMVLEGYALKFESPARHKYGDMTYVETIKRGSLDHCDMSDVVLRYNHHDTWLIMARTRNHSLKLRVDQTGLFIHADLIDTTTNKDVYRAVKAGLLDKMSFAFTIAPHGDSVRSDKANHIQYRDIISIDRLFDVAVVDVPFYNSSEVHVVDKNAHRTAPADLELEKRKRIAILQLTILNDIERN